ncbi:hypothetical protein C0993_009614 [Termitomyces sp. T159_Od127]|nr:hypothetical protein C0993_009614 [Termitomyces sp. T159_Od127]
MSDTTSSSAVTPSASSSTSLSTSAAGTASSSTSTSSGLPTSTTSSDSLSTATTTTTTALTETATSSSTTDTTSSTATPSIATVTSTSTPLATLTPPATTTSQSTSTTSVVGGPAVITTSTAVVVVSPFPTQAPSRTAAPSSSNNTFFENKGAVAGVFTVVGLIVAALFIILVFTVIRRRRARQFDREVEAAAAEAAAAPAPHFLDDDDEDPYRHPADQPAAYVDHPQYSDISSHGTYSQPALGSQEAYGMRDLGPAPAELYNNPYVTGGAAGAAGVGVARARSTRDPGAFASGFQDGATPYPAFAGPAAFQSGAYGNGGGYDSLDTGVGVGIGAGMQRGMSLNHHPNVDYATNDQEQQYSQGLHPGQYVQQSDLVRNPSQVTYSTTHASSTLASSPASPPLSKEQSPYAANYASAPVQEVDEGAYGGYTDDLEGARHMQEGRHSYQHDDEDEGRPKILKVCTYQARTGVSDMADVDNDR